jgi:hypothetical protein
MWALSHVPAAHGGYEDSNSNMQIYEKSLRRLPARIWGATGAADEMSRE